MKSIARKFYYFFMNLKITQKLIIGYLAIVLYPTLLMNYHFYQTNYQSLLQDYLSNEQMTLNTVSQNFNIRLNQTASLTKLLSGNSALYSYLSGAYYDLAESLYIYIDDIRPIFQQFSAHNSVSLFDIYVFQEYTLTIHEYFPLFETLPEGEALLEQLRCNVNGFWCVEKMDETCSLVYYKAFYNANYSDVLGIIRLEMDMSQYLNQLLPETGAHETYFLEDLSSGCTYKFLENGLLEAELPTQPEFTVQNAEVISSPLRIIHIFDASNAVNYQVFNILPLLVGILGMMTLLYIFIFRSTLQRLLVLAKYISTADVANLKPYDGTIFHDEIGLLTDTVNDMINRTNQLIHENYQMELVRKDAEYYALQAQIKPHFLYNILENIRMNAEINHAHTTSDMLLTLGKFMRYNLNNNMNELPLSSELECARNYLELQEIRMTDLLNYRIESCTEIDDIFCPRFILQPLLENSIKHGANEGVPLHISILIQDDPNCEDRVQIIVRDDGKGLCEEQLILLNQNFQNDVMDSNNHVGLCNVNSRLVALNGLDSALQITSPVNGGCCVCFCLNRQTVSKGD